jgi:hypothetical protein
MGCCLAVLLLAGAPRVALVLWWFSDPSRVVGSFGNWVITSGSLSAPTWIFPVLGFVLLPWTTVAYVFVAPGGVNGFEWLIVGLALLIDLSTHGGSGRAYRSRRSSD